MIFKATDFIPPIFTKSFKKLVREKQRRDLNKKICKYNKLHIGSGIYNVYDGWLNVDFSIDPKNRENYQTWDLTMRMKLPVGSIQYCFTEHFVEHIKKYQFLSLMEEIFNSLISGGVLRISTPDLETIVDKYLKGVLYFWKDMNWSPASATDLINEGFHSWGHCYIWSFTEISQCLKEIGFSEVYRVNHGSSKFPELNGLEGRSYHGDLIIEAIK